MRLTNKQEKFCYEFVISGNKSLAYRAAYDTETMSSESVNVEASKLSRNPKVALRIAQLKQRASEILEMSHQDVLLRLKTWAESDITETIGLSTEEIKQLPDKVRQLVTKYRHTKRNIRNKEGAVIESIEVVELHFVSKEKALDMINRHIGFYERDNSQKETDNIVIFNIPDNGR